MSRTIVVIDDSLTVRKVAERQLKTVGFEVAGAATGREGIAAVQQHEPDLVLLDFMLPDMKGTEVCAGLAASESTSEIPVIVLSGRDAGQLRSSFSGVKAVKACIEKPFGSQLVEQVQAVLLDSAEPTDSRSASGAVAREEAAASPRPSARSAEARTGSGEDRVGRIVNEILSVLDRSPETRRVMLRILVRRYLSDGR